MENKKDENFVESIRAYIEQNYADKNISVAFFREMTGYSIMHINRVYKKEYWNMTPIEHLHKVRMEEAKKFIKEGVPLGMVANKVGCYSMRTFYRSFEKSNGMTPTQYKQKWMKDHEWLKDSVSNQLTRPIDYAKNACGTMMLQYDASELYPVAIKEGISRYSFQQGIFLLGMYNTYKLCNEKRYLNYILEWVDVVTDSEYKVKFNEWFTEDQTRETLDAYQPIALLARLCGETGDSSYLKTVEYIKENFATYPKTRDGILWHISWVPHQVHLNSVYMMCPSLCWYGRLTGDENYYDIAADQAIQIYRKLRDDKTGLIRRSYDESKTAEWADPETGLATEVWGRALGYYVMGLVDMLEILPETHPCREELIKILKDTIDAVAKYQDGTGIWYQIVDLGNTNGNWLEISSSCMFVYTMAKAINLGIISGDYEEKVIKGYSGIIDTVEYGEKGEMILNDICEEMNIEQSSAYINSKNLTNSLLGVGLFVHMCNEMEKFFKNI